MEGIAGRNTVLDKGDIIAKNDTKIMMPTFSQSEKTVYGGSGLSIEGPISKRWFGCERSVSLELDSWSCGELPDFTGLLNVDELGLVDSGISWFAIFVT